MSIDRQILRPFGILSMLASLPILEASLMAAAAFFEEGGWRTGDQCRVARDVSRSQQL